MRGGSSLLRRYLFYSLADRSVISFLSYFLVFFFFLIIIL